MNRSSLQPADQASAVPVLDDFSQSDDQGRFKVSTRIGIALSLAVLALAMSETSADERQGLVHDSGISVRTVESCG